MNPLFNLPPEEAVLKRNISITSYYARLYLLNPLLYKWCGMAAFASYHMGKRMEKWDWSKSDIESFSATCEKKSLSLDDDFNIIREINNEIFAEMAWMHQLFHDKPFEDFLQLLNEQKKHHILIESFTKLNQARELLKNNSITPQLNTLVWEANTGILWHEQSRVVQPMFDKLGKLFSGAMTLFATFDYTINYQKTNWKNRSRFWLFMYARGFCVLRDHYFIPDVTYLSHRWFWIKKDILKNWKKIEKKNNYFIAEIETLSNLNPHLNEH